MATKIQKIMTQPINLIFRWLQNRARIQLMLFENTDLRIEGRIIVRKMLNLLSCSSWEPQSYAPQGFDEYMNLVLDDAEEVHLKKNTRKKIGRIMLKGDNISLMMNVSQ